MSYLLGIDSSNLNGINLCLGSLKSANNESYFDLEVSNKSSAEAIIPGIAQLLKDNNVAIGEVEKILLTSGPGSFTGIRNAMSSAFGLGFGLKKDIFATSILHVDAYLGVNGKRVLLFKKANNNEYYSQYFEFENKKIIREKPLMIILDRDRNIHLKEVLAAKDLDNQELQLLEIEQKSGVNTAHGLITFYQDNPEYFLQVFDQGTFKANVEADYVKPVNAKTLVERGIGR